MGEKWTTVLPSTIDVDFFTVWIRSGLDSCWPLRDAGENLKQTHQVGARFETLTEDVFEAPLHSRYIQVGFNLISVQV